MKIKSGKHGSRSQRKARRAEGVASVRAVRLSSAHGSLIADTLSESPRKNGQPMMR